MTNAAPLDDFRALFDRLPLLDEAAAAEVARLFSAHGNAASRLAAMAQVVARTTGKAPSVSRPSAALFAAAHGVAGRGVSRRRLDATLATVAACGSGDAPISHLCAAQMIGLRVYDLALHLPTGDIAEQPSMDARTCAATMAFGMEAIAGGPDLMLLGAIGSTGDETVAAALLAAVHGTEADRFLDQGDDLFDVRRQTVAAALARVAGTSDALSLLGELGGREIAALVGAIVAARVERIPVMLDGLQALAAASVVAAIDRAAIAHCLLASTGNGAEAGAAARLGLDAILGGGLSAGEATAAAIATSVLRDGLTLNAGFAARERAQQQNHHSHHSH